MPSISDCMKATPEPLQGRMPSYQCKLKRVVPPWKRLQQTQTLAADGGSWDTKVGATIGVDCWVSVTLPSPCNPKAGLAEGEFSLSGVIY